MVQIVLVGLGAGAAAAFLSPLPILIAVFGWSHIAGLIAALSAAIALAAAFGAIFFFAFLAGAGIPAWWFGYLAMLARPVPNGSQQTLEWYPPGRLVVWAAVLAGLVVIVAIPNFGTDAESFRAGLQRGLERMIRFPSDTPVGRTRANVGTANPDRLINFLVMAIPPAAAVLATVTNVFNLWLAAKIVKFSGRLRRPWPNLSSLEFPRLTAIAFAAAIAASFLDGLPGIAGGVLAASLLMAFGILGFAVLHTLTRGIGSRAFVLTGVYAAVIVFGWPVLVMCVLGLAEMAFNIRDRINRRRGPPALT
jgi:hypothetical protein